MEKKTHILIPIKDIDNWIAEIKISGLTITPFEEAEIQTLERIKEGKQISLNEEDIEEKAVEYADNGNWEFGEDDNFTNRRNAYKQALKDLL